MKVLRDASLLDPEKLPFALWFVQHRAKNAPRKFLSGAVFKLRRTTLQKSSCVEPCRPSKSCAGLQKTRAVCEFSGAGIFETPRRRARRACALLVRRPWGPLRSVAWRPRGLAVVPGLCCRIERKFDRATQPEITRLNSYIFAEAINNVRPSYAVVRHLPSRNKPGRIWLERTAPGVELIDPGKNQFARSMGRARPHGGRDMLQKR